MVFEPAVYLGREYLAVLAAMDVRLIGNFFLGVTDVEGVLVGRATFEVGRFWGFVHCNVTMCGCGVAVSVGS